jgi:hypothetical protein
MSFSRLLRQTANQRATFLAFSPSSRAAGSDGATRRHHPSQGHGSSPEAFHPIPGCMADIHDSIVPGQFSFSPGFDAELPAVPAPQRAMLLPHQLHISTSRKLLECPWSPCASAKTEIPQESNQSPHDRAESPNCAYRRGATESMHLWAGIASVSASFAASQAPCLHAQIIYQAQ